MQTHTNVDLLERAERYVEVYPDSAMQLLNLIQYPERLHDKESADYALLWTQVLDKNNLDSLQSDSLLLSEISDNKIYPNQNIIPT